MIEKELFYKIAERNFQAFEIVTEQDIIDWFSLYPDKDKMRSAIQSKWLSYWNQIRLKEKTTIEIYLILSEFCLKNQITLWETCAIFKIISDVLLSFSQNLSQEEIYNKFKEGVLKFSMNRFKYQIGIFRKETVYLITNFFVDIIYQRYYLLKYSLTNKINIQFDTKELSLNVWPPVESLGNAVEILPRNAKILRQYFESRRPKTELEQKIDIVLEFERERWDQKMEKIFEEQDVEFNKKVDELLKKKK